MCKSLRSRTGAPVGTRMQRSLMLLAATMGCVAQSQQVKKAQRTPVVVATAESGSVPITLNANGTVEAMQSVALQARVSGPVIAVHFAEGDQVHAGQLLFEIDSTPYRITLDQARALLARDRASASAAGNDAARYDSLVSKGYVTAEQAEQLNASAAALAATVKADQAAVSNAELNLAFTRVLSPIDGQTGSLNVRVGNQVNGPTGTPLVTINSVTPVHVRFAVADRDLAAVRAAQRGGRGLEVVVRDSSAGDVRGIVDFIDNAVDTVSGTVMLKARFANTDRRLWPGAFVPVTLTLGATSNAVLVPSVAVQQGPTGSYVFEPDSGGRAKQVPVTILRTVGNVAIVASGVAAGDKVVIDGQSLLYAGAPLTVSNAAASSGTK